MPLWGTEAAVLALGLCGGVPLGPLTALELYRGGSIGKRQAEYLCTFSCTPSLSFIISFVGSILDRQIGMELALLTVLFAVFTAIIAKPLMLKPNERSIKPTLRSSSKPFSVVLASSAVSAVIVCGCVVFFGSMAEMLPKGIGGLLEISAGIARCRSATEAAVLLGFSGVSILCQCSAACNGELDMLPCMTAKVIQASFMGGIAFFIID